MRATIKNYIEAAKQRRAENGEGGFSLIELIVVVAILGILVAIAIPVFGAIQTSAKQNAANTIAANAVTQAAASMAQGTAVTGASLANLKTGNVTAVGVGGTTAIENLCGKAVVDSVTGYAGKLTGGTCTTTVDAP